MKKLLMMTLITTLLLVGCGVQKEEKMTRIQYVRNATMKIEYGDKTFVTDPMFSEKGTLPGFLNPNAMVNPTSEMTISAEDLLKGADALLVSHSHIPADEVPSPPSDHFDPVAIDLIQKDFPIYLQPFDEAGLTRLGFTNLTAIESSIDLDGVKMTRITGKHVNIEELEPMIGESSGYVLEKEGYPTMLWTGDTLLTDEIKEAIKNFKPEIIIAHAGGAMLPIDAEGNFATLLMNDDDVIEMAKLAPQAKIIAIHIEALDHCPVTRDGLREKVEAAGLENIFIPANGEILEI